MAQQLSTAQRLVIYRGELVSGGIPADRADDMVRDAASRLIQADGLDVRDEPT